MSLEDPVRAAGERLQGRLKQGAEDGLRGFLSELAEAVRHEQDSATEEARRAAAGELARRVEAELVIVRAQAEATLAARLEAAQAEADERVAKGMATARADIAAQVAEVRAEAERAHATEIAALKTEAEEQLRVAREDAEQTRAIELAAVRTEVTREQAARVASEQVRARHTLVSELREAEADGLKGLEEDEALEEFAQVLRGIEQLDQAHTLSEVLNSLADGAATAGVRIALLVVRGQRLLGWRFVNLGDSDPRSVNVDVAEAGVVGRAVTTGKTQALKGRLDEALLGALRFGPQSQGRAALAVPVRVGGSVTAVVYAVSTNALRQPAASALRTTLEILARHAGHCLQALTAVRITQLAATRPNRARQIDPTLQTVENRAMAPVGHHS